MNYRTRVDEPIAGIAGACGFLKDNNNEEDDEEKDEDCKGSNRCLGYQGEYATEV